MPNLLQTGVAWLGGVLKSSASEAGTYSRGARTATLSATRGRSETQAEASGIVRTEYDDGDWIFIKADFVFPAAGGNPLLAIVPEKGDRWATATETWEVLAMADKKNHQEIQGGLVRVHTKQVGP
jgi:hypothetical protein